jgi:hypothetical protein
MKAIIEFNLPEETQEHKDALNGWKYKSIIKDIFTELRKKRKYADIESMDIDQITEMIREIESEYDLDN